MVNRYGLGYVTDDQCYVPFVIIAILFLSLFMTYHPIIKMSDRMNVISGSWTDYPSGVRPDFLLVSY